MTDRTAQLRHQIGNAADLQSVVRTMRALAASNISEYERSVAALADYNRAVDLGLGACLRKAQATPVVPHPARRGKTPRPGAIVFGSDQGLAGQFNEVIVDFALHTLAKMPGNPAIWAVGERVRSRLVDAGLPVVACYEVPSSVEAIAPFVGRILLDTETHNVQDGAPALFVFHNRPRRAVAYAPVQRRLLPLDAAWHAERSSIRWPSPQLPEVMGAGSSTLRALIREYLFISLYRACAESLASENASRLAAMERADKNIEDLLAKLRSEFHQLRQAAIDEELSDVVCGFEAMKIPRTVARMR